LIKEIDMEELIIAKAIEFCKADFMQYPDFDDTIPLSLADAITIFLSQELEEIPTEEIYDFIDNKLK
jgi:hypothetical protein